MQNDFFSVFFFTVFRVHKNFEQKKETKTGGVACRVSVMVVFSLLKTRQIPGFTTETTPRSRQL